MVSKKWRRIGKYAAITGAVIGAGALLIATGGAAAPVVAGAAGAAQKPPKPPAEPSFLESASSTVGQLTGLVGQVGGLAGAADKAQSAAAGGENRAAEGSSLDANATRPVGIRAIPIIGTIVRAFAGP